MVIVNKKGQVATTDLLISIIILLFFIGMMVTVFWWGSKKAGTNQLYGGIVFDNLENMGPEAFLHNYRVDNTNLANFKSLNNDAMKSKILTDTEFDPYTSDVCVFIVDKTTGPSYIAGEAYDVADHSSRSNCAVNSPCEHYTNSFIYAKPALNQTKINNLLIVVCKV